MHWLSENANLVKMLLNDLAANPTVVAANQQVEFLVLGISLATGASTGAIKSVIAAPSNAKLVLVRHASANMAQPILPTLTLLGPTHIHPSFLRICNTLSTLLHNLVQIPFMPFPGMDNLRQTLPIRLLLRTLRSIKTPIFLLTRHTSYLLVPRQSQRSDQRYP